MEFITLKSLVSGVSITLNSFQTIAKALEVMSENSISSIVIVDENLHPIGIFTEFDALRVVSETIDKQTLLYEVMTKNPFCVEETLYLHDAYELMEHIPTLIGKKKNLQNKKYFFILLLILSQI